MGSYTGKHMTAISFELVSCSMGLPTYDNARSFELVSGVWGVLIMTSHKLRACELGHGVINTAVPGHGGNRILLGAVPVLSAAARMTMPEAPSLRAASWVYQSRLAISFELVSRVMVNT